MPKSEIIVDSAINIVTPENIAFRYEVAGPFRRLPAYVLDLAVRAALLMALGLGVMFLGIAIGGSLAFALFILVLFLMEWFYGGIFETYWNGQTPGKRMLGLRVLTLDGRPINGLQAVLRNILRGVDLMPLLPLTILDPEAVQVGIFPTFFVGFVAMMFNCRFQRLGDLVCGTMVVVEERSWLFGISKVDDPRAAQLAEYIPANFIIDRQLSRALATYVERRKFFSQARRREIARHIARPLINKFHLPADTSPDLMLCALYHRAFIADRADDEMELLESAGRPFAEVPR